MLLFEIESMTLPLILFVTIKHLSLCQNLLAHEELFVKKLTTTIWGGGVLLRQACQFFSFEKTLLYSIREIICLTMKSKFHK